MKLKINVSSINHTIHLPSYRKHLGIGKIKFIEETVLAEEKMMLILEDLNTFQYYNYPTAVKPFV